MTSTYSDVFECPASHLSRIPQTVIASDIRWEYFRHGWAGVVNHYKRIKDVKSLKAPDLLSIKNLLDSLQKYRVKIINDLFKISIRILLKMIRFNLVNTYVNYWKLKSVGSTNITSDYDVTILSDYAPELCILIILEYNKGCKLSKNLIESTDTNLYTIGYFRANIPMMDLRTMRQLYLTDVVGIEPANIYGKKQMIIFSCLALQYDLSIIVNPNIRNIILNLLSILLPMRSKDIVYQYIAHCYYSSQLYNTIYNHRLTHLYNSIIPRFKIPPLNLVKQDINTLLEKNSMSPIDWIIDSCVGSFLQIDAYYTFCTTNVIVLEMQSAKRLTPQSTVFKDKHGAYLDIDIVNYYCACIENIGKILPLLSNHQHLSGDKLSDKINKYITRIIYCLDNIKEDTTINILEIGEISKEINIKPRNLVSLKVTFKKIISIILEKYFPT